MGKKETENYMSAEEPVWIVAPGLEITSRRGILKSGDEVKPQYFKHGQKTIDDLISNGSVIKK